MSSKHKATLCRKFERSLIILGKKWNPLIIESLMQQPLRFCQLRDSINGISDRVLNERLCDLRKVGLVTKDRVETDNGYYYSYRLTEKGEALGPTLSSLHEWADEWISLDELEPVDEKKLVQ